MVNACSVYGCTSNYNKMDKTNYIPIFTFFVDSDRKRSEWIRKILNENLKDTRNFEDKDIKRFDIFKCANGDPDIKVSIYC